MTKHIPRKDRWASFGPSEYRSEWGRVFFRAGQWHASIVYQVADPETLQPGELQTWESSGRYKRPRNAMMVLEEEVKELQRKYGDRITFLKPG